MNNESHYFILNEKQLSDLWSSITYAPSDCTVRTQMLLSKPEHSEPEIEDISENCYLLTLSEINKAILLSTIASGKIYDQDRTIKIISDHLARGQSRNK